MDSKPRVLIVDNDPRWRTSYQISLIDWGYCPFVAEGQGPALLQDAVKKANQHRCHIALVDMRLLDHDSRADYSGLNLLPKLKPTESVIVSGYGDVAAVTTALLKKGAKHFVGKEEGPDPLEEVLHEVTQPVCAAKSPIQIEWPVELSPPQIISRLFPNVSQIPADQINDLLAHLFPEAKHLRIQSLNESLKTPKSAPRGYSAVLKVYVDDWFQPQVVKIAPSNDIKNEQERYTKHVIGMLNPNYYATMERHVCLWDVGGAWYQFVGDSTQAMTSLAQCYQSAQSANHIVKALTFFFNDIWSNYYREAESSADKSLFEAYCNVWGTKWYKRLQTYSEQDHLLSYDLNLKRLNPVTWFLREVEQSQQSNSNAMPLTRLAITHGDLHGDNLFVDDGRAWVIDYERTGLGPILQDFVELEVNILIQLAKFKTDDMRVFHRVLVTLLAAKSADEIPSVLPIEHVEANKALNVIKALRKLAEEKTGGFDQDKYLWGLLFDTLFLVSLPELNSQERKGQRQRALLLGCLICEQLECKSGRQQPDG